MPTIALLSTSDTDLLSAKASGADYRWANPARPSHTDMGAAIEGADIVIARILGSPQDLCSGFRRIAATGKPVIVLGGEQAPNAALMELSTVAPGVVHEAHRYLAHGGADNLRHLHAFLSDTLLLTGEGFEPPAELPVWGALERPGLPALAGGATRPRVAVLFYRAQQAAGNTDFAHALADAIEWGRDHNFIGKNAKALHDSVAAVSVGIIDGEPMLDLAYTEDSRAETDMNVVVTGRGLFVEVQGTAEGAPFDRRELDSLLDLALGGAADLTALQVAALA